MDKTVFGAVIKDAHLKAENNDPHKADIRAAGGKTEESALNMSGSPCTPCVTDGDQPAGNSLHDINPGGTDGIETRKNESEHTTCASGPAKDLHNGALLLKMANSNGVKTEEGSVPVRVNGEFSEGIKNESGMQEKEVNSESNAGKDEPVHISLCSDASDDTEKDITCLNNVMEEDPVYSLVSNNSAEIKDASGINPENEEGGGFIASAPGRTRTESSSENGLKSGDPMNRIPEQSDALDSNDDMPQEAAEIERHVPSEEAVEAHEPVFDTEADHAVSKRNMVADRTPENDVSKNNLRGNSEKPEADMDVAVHNEGTDGLPDAMMEDSLNQFNRDEKPGNDVMRFARTLNNAATDVSGNNVHPVNAADAANGSARAMANISHSNAAHGAEFQQLMDDIVYIIKSPNRLGVSVEHETLGKLNINVTLEKGLVNVHIHTSDKGVRELIEHNVQQIVDSLDRDGVSVGEFTIALKDNQNREDAFNHVNGGREKELMHAVQEENTARGLVNIFV